MSKTFNLKDTLFLILKGIAAAIAGIIGLMIGGMIANALSLTQPELPENMDTNLILISFFCCWFFTSIILDKSLKEQD